MAHHEDIQLPPRESRQLGEHAWPVYRNAFIVGAIGLLVALLAAGFAADGMRRFAFAYTTSFAFVLSIALGSLFFVLIQHLTKAGWSVLVRRPAEIFAANFPIVALLFLPILIFVLLNNGELYPWAQPLPHHHGEAAHAAEHAQAGHDANIITVVNEHDGHGATETQVADHSAHGQESAHAPEAHSAEGEMDPTLLHAIEGKRGYLNIPFFVARWIVYLALWSGMGLWYWRKSTQQDVTGDDQLTERMQSLSPLMVLLFGLTATFAAFDLLMSLDPVWYSTIFGVYYFAGSFLSAVATMVLVLMGLQRLGFCQSVTTEHFHDLGKWMFAFVFFWGYIAYSQYMLIWYANLPETTYWFDLRGVTTVPGQTNGWTWVSLALLFGHLLIPFGLMLSRHVKRNRQLLAFWAIWLLVFHWLDLYWLVMPNFTSSAIPGIVEIGCLVGIVGIFFGGAVRIAAQNSLVPVKDPRLAESLGFHNL